MNKPTTNILSTNTQLIIILIISAAAAVAIVLISPAIFDLINAARRGQITSITIIFSSLSFTVLFIIGLFTRRWLVLTPSYPLLGYMLVSLIVNFFAPKPQQDFRWLLISIALPLIYITVTGFFRDYRSLALIMLGTIFISFFIVILLTFTDSNGNFPTLNGVLRNRYRVYMGHNQYGPITLATISSTLLILTVGFQVLLSQKSRLVKYILIISIVFSLIGLVASGGRAAWVSTLISMVLMITLTRKNRIKIPVQLILLVILGFASFAIILLASGWRNQQVIERFNTLIPVLISPTEDASLHSRVVFWEYAINILYKSPLGVGFSAFNQEYGATTHNEYLNILLGSGVIGFLLFLSFYFINAWIVLRALQTHRNYGYKNLLIIIFPFLIHAAIISISESWSASNSFVAIVFWILFSIGGAAAHFQIQHERAAL